MNSSSRSFINEFYVISRKMIVYYLPNNTYSMKEKDISLRSEKEVEKVRLLKRESNTLSLGLLWTPLLALNA
jgi:hypothetical protein